MATIPMKTLIIGEYEFEVVDEVARATMEVGSVAMTAANAAPSDGIWVSIGKEFAEQELDNIFTLNSSKVSAASVTAHLVGHHVRIHGSATPSAQMASGTLGTIDFSALGINAISRTYSIASQAVGPSGILTINASGELSVGAIMPTSVYTKFSANTPIWFDFILQIPSSDKINTFCDKFFWKRMA